MEKQNKSSIAKRKNKTRGLETQTQSGTFR